MIQAFNFQIVFGVETLGIDDDSPVVNQAIDYIYRNLDEPITAVSVADHCCYSRHHFNRLFQYTVNETIYSFIKRQRLEKSASMIVKFPNLSLTDIASEIGYSSSNYTVAFKNYYMMSPSEFREGLDSENTAGQNSMVDKIRANIQRHSAYQADSGIYRNVSVKRIPCKCLQYKRFIGSYGNLDQVWKHFIAALTLDIDGLPPVLYGLTYNDPLISDERRCIHDFCVEVPQPEGQQYRLLPESDYLCFRFRGSVKNIYMKYNEFMSLWVPVNYPRLLNRVCLEIYYPCIEKSLLDMEICIPLNNN